MRECWLSHQSEKQWFNRVGCVHTSGDDVRVVERKVRLTPEPAHLLNPVDHMIVLLQVILERISSQRHAPVCLDLLAGLVDLACWVLQCPQNTQAMRSTISNPLK